MYLTIYLVLIHVANSKKKKQKTKNQNSKYLEMRAVYIWWGLGLSHSNAPFLSTPCGILPWEAHHCTKQGLLLWCLGKVLFSSINRKNLSLAQDTGKVIFKVDMLHKFDLKESRNFQ